MCRRVIVALGLTVMACSPALDWRESRHGELGFVVSLPGKPLVAARDIAFDGATLPMTMVSVGREGTLFAVGVAQLPAAAVADAAAVQQTTGRFAESLRRNVHATVPPADGAVAVPSLTRSFAAGRLLRADTAFSARGDMGSTGSPGAVGGKARAVHLYARLVVADDRLYQLVALGSAEQLTAQALDTFFQSFRLLPTS
jgi:hypothetical protein